MRALIILIGGILSAAILMAVFGPDEYTADDQWQTALPGLKKAAKNNYLKTDSTGIIALKADDGSSRTGYAQYLCEELRDLGITKGGMIRVHSHQGKMLGEHYCKP